MIHNNTHAHSLILIGRLQPNSLTKQVDIFYEKYLCITLETMLDVYQPQVKILVLYASQKTDLSVQKSSGCDIKAEVLYTSAFTSLQNTHSIFAE